MWRASFQESWLLRRSLSSNSSPQDVISSGTLKPKTCYWDDVYPFLHSHVGSLYYPVYSVSALIFRTSFDSAHWWIFKEKTLIIVCRCLLYSRVFSCHLCSKNAFIQSTPTFSVRFFLPQIIACLPSCILYILMRFLSLVSHQIFCRSRIVEPCLKCV